MRGDDTQEWVCDYEDDHFNAKITSGGAGSYTFQEEYPPGSVVANGRTGTATEMNGFSVPINSHVTVFEFNVSGTKTYYFAYENVGITTELDDGSEVNTNVTTVKAHTPTFDFGNSVLSLNWGTNIQPVGSFNYPGVEELAARVDHIHAGIIPNIPPPVIVNNYSYYYFDTTTNILRIFNYITNTWVCVQLSTTSCGSGSGPGSGPFQPCNTRCSNANGVTPCDGTPLVWVVTVSGFTGNSAAFNGTFALRWNANCSWNATFGSGRNTGSWTLFFDGTNWILKGDIGALGGIHVSYVLSKDAFACCGSNTMAYSSGVNVSTPPSTLLVVANTDCDSCGGGSGGSGSGGGGGTINSPCCPGRLLPSRLYAHFSGATGTCACLNGLVIPIDYIGGNIWQESGFTSACSASLQVNMQCDNVPNTWGLGITGCPFTFVSSFASCTPALHVQFAGTPTVGTCCVGNITVDVLETP
jgi:hypothetical protein